MLKKQQPTGRIQQQKQEAVSIENVDTKKRPHTVSILNCTGCPFRVKFITHGDLLS